MTKKTQLSTTLLLCLCATAWGAPGTTLRLVNLGSPTPMRHNYKSYSPTALTNAFLDVKNNKTSVHKAAITYSVPEQTLRDRVIGKINIDTVKSGASPVFDNEEELRLVDHVKYMASIGYGYTRKEVIQLGSDYACQLGKRDHAHPLSIKWLYGLLGRWPEIKIRSAKSLTELRAKSSSEECVKRYFDELGAIFEKYDFTSRPEAIYNVDEKGLNQSHVAPKIVGSRDSVAYEISSERSSLVTLLGCGNALGTFIPPFFVFAGARMRSELLEGCSPGSDGSMSESGWSNGAIFQDYLDKHFLRYATPATPRKPLLLLYDGHKSHISPVLIDWANIVLFVLPAHTSHILQPMDVGCFGPFTKIYNAECHKLLKSGQTVNRYNIASVACKAYTAALTPSHLQSSFRKCGIYPFSPDVIDKTAFQPAAFIHESHENETSKEIPPRQDRPTPNNTPDVQIESDLPTRTCQPETDQTTFFSDHLPVLQKKTRKPRRSIHKIVGGRAITEPEVEKAVKNYVKDSIVGKSSQSKKRPRKQQSRKPLQKKSKTTTEPLPGPSGAVNLLYSSDSEEDSPVTDDEKCCVCGRFQPSELSRCTSLFFVKWGQCMYDKCDHWVHLQFCCPVRVLRTHDTFYCPCHGLPCKPSEE